MLVPLLLEINMLFLLLNLDFCQEIETFIRLIFGCSNMTLKLYAQICYTHLLLSTKMCLLNNMLWKYKLLTREKEDISKIYRLSIAF